jgi:hypothetical protein
LRIHPYARNTALTPNRHLAVRPPDNDGDVARAVNGAEQHNRSAGKAGRDGDQVVGEIGD